MADNYGKFKVFVGNIPQGTTEEEIKAAFEVYGAVQEIYLPRRKGFEDQLQGFSFVTYGDEDVVARVLGLTTIKFKGQDLKISSAVRKVLVFPLSFFYQSIV
jgi:cold-inducible RNA-binding protein